mmetsp:Transcript_64376/g.140146  ORF Transcript_64376/g.140146 Transcript_64376/m.140146 type:complete len:205 (+) Transcript_64376:295-909(+)
MRRAPTPRSCRPSPPSSTVSSQQTSVANVPRSSPPSTRCERRRSFCPSTCAWVSKTSRTRAPLPSTASCSSPSLPLCSTPQRDSATSRSSTRRRRKEKTWRNVNLANLSSTWGHTSMPASCSTPPTPSTQISTNNSETNPARSSRSTSSICVCSSRRSTISRPRTRDYGAVSPSTSSTHARWVRISRGGVYLRPLKTRASPATS